jgi:hypothetical protein
MNRARRVLVAVLQVGQQRHWALDALDTVRALHIIEVVDYHRWMLYELRQQGREAEWWLR